MWEIAKESKQFDQISSSILISNWSPALRSQNGITYQNRANAKLIAADIGIIFCKIPNGSYLFI